MPSKSDNEEEENEEDVAGVGESKRSSSPSKDRKKKKKSSRSKSPKKGGRSEGKDDDDGDDGDGDGGDGEKRRTRGRSPTKKEGARSKSKDKDGKKKSSRGRSKERLLPRGEAKDNSSEEEEEEEGDKKKKKKKKGSRSKSPKKKKGGRSEGKDDDADDDDDEGKDGEGTEDDADGEKKKPARSRSFSPFSPFRQRGKQKGKKDAPKAKEMDRGGDGDGDGGGSDDDDGEEKGGERGDDGGKGGDGGGGGGGGDDSSNDGSNDSLDAGMQRGRDRSPRLGADGANADGGPRDPRKKPNSTVTNQPQGPALSADGVYGSGDDAMRRGVRLNHCLCMERSTCAACCCNSDRAGNWAFALQKWACGPLSCLSWALRDAAHECVQRSTLTFCGVEMEVDVNVGLHLLPNEPDREREEAIKRDRETGSVQCKDDDVCLVTVVGTSPLNDDVALLHPIVRVHVVDMYTGRYMGRAPPKIERMVSGAVIAEGDYDEEEEEEEDDEGGEGGKKKRGRRRKRTQSPPPRPGGTTTYENWTELFKLRGAPGSANDLDKHGANSKESSSQRTDDGERHPALKGRGGRHFRRDAGVVLPVATRPHLVKKRNTTLSWTGMDGTLMINEPYETFLDPRALFLVEVADFGAAEHGGTTEARMRENNGFVGLAWGFLMPIGLRGHPNIGHRGDLHEARGSAALGISRSDSVAHLRAQNLRDEGEEGAAIVQAVRDSATGPQNLKSEKGVDQQSRFAGAKNGERRPSVALHGENVLNPRLLVQLYHWQRLGAVAKAQGRARGLWGMPPPASSLVPPVYLQWLMKNRRRYPATLTIRVGPVKRTKPYAIKDRPTLPTHVERGSKDAHLDDMERYGFGQETATGQLVKEDTDRVPPHVFKRLWDGSVGEKCVPPARLLCRRSVGRDGAFSLAYSHSGRYLAVAACDGEQHFPIQIYDLDAEEGKAVLKGPELSGHVSIVYDMDWSEDDRFLVSASADGTARVWALENITKPKARTVTAAGSSSSSSKAGVGTSDGTNDAGGDNDNGGDGGDGDEDEEAKAAGEGGGPESPSGGAMASGAAAATEKKKAEDNRKAAREAATAAAMHSSSGGRLYKVLQHSPPTFLYAACFVPAHQTLNAGGDIEGKDDDDAPGPALGSSGPDGAAASSSSSSSSSNNNNNGGGGGGSLFEKVTPCPPVLTGAFDGSLRMWNVENAADQKGVDLGLLGGYAAPVHRRSVMAVVVDKANRRVYSGDADGVVWPWIWEGAGNHPKNFPAERPLIHPALRGRSICSLALQPKRSRQRKHLLVAARGNLLMLFDMGAKSLLVQYHGASIRSSMIRACFSPDGKMVVSGSEEGRCTVWNAWVTNESGSLITPQTRKPCALSEMGFNAPLLGVAWNPKQHCVAMAAAGGSYPVLVAYSERVEHVASPGGHAGGMMQGSMGMMGGFGSPMTSHMHMGTANAMHAMGGQQPHGGMFEHTAMTNTLGHHVPAGGVAGGGGGGGGGGGRGDSSLALGADATGDLLGSAYDGAEQGALVAAGGDFMSERLAAAKAKKAKRDRVAAKLADFKAKREAAKFTALANNSNIVNQQSSDALLEDGANDENKPMLGADSNADL